MLVLLIIFMITFAAAQAAQKFVEVASGDFAPFAAAQAAQKCKNEDLGLCLGFAAAQAAQK